MDIEILSVIDGGSYSSEYVVLKVLNTCNIGDYLIMDKTFAPSGNTSNLWKHTYWFPRLVLTAGNFIFLHTKPGTNKPTKTNKGTDAYSFHMGLSTSVWNNSGDNATLVKVASSKTVKVN